MTANQYDAIIGKQTVGYGLQSTVPGSQPHGK
jgi:hypothetical protein